MVNACLGCLWALKFAGVGTMEWDTLCVSTGLWVLLAVVIAMINDND